MLEKVCKCGKLTTDGVPIWCPDCHTFTHTAHVRAILDNLNKAQNLPARSVEHTAHK